MRTSRNPKDFKMRVRVSEDGRKKIYDFYIDRFATIKYGRLIIWRNEDDLTKSKIQFLPVPCLGDFRNTQGIELAEAVFEAVEKCASTARYCIKYYREKGVPFTINQAYVVKESNG
jgi:hypothetical protein